ncbi:MAG: hypothetical protein JKY58_04365 [Pseudomonas sp.]|nr:hypothetical protein [Pseudomonas sp.]|tara:strand:+ start:21612 stop:22256 length:645 start_codon:yes stop_codon:yes gene_type:complete
MDNQRKLLALFVFTAFLPSASWGCEQLELLSPLKGETVSSVRPELSWAPASAGSTGVTRLQVLSYVPEGGVIKTVDTATQENIFRPTTDLARSHAAVKVLITRNCSDITHESLIAQPAAFFIDPTLACPSPENPEAILGEGYAFVSWVASERATGYESYISGPQITKPQLFEAAHDVTHLKLSAPTTPSLVNLRSICPEGASKWVTISMAKTAR